MNLVTLLSEVPDTRRILQGLDAHAVEDVQRRHTAYLHIRQEGDICPVAIDGKILRGAFDAFADRKAAHLLSAFATHDQIILGHVAVDGKSNEIPAAQELIADLGLIDVVFTLDAMHCQKNIRGSLEHRQ